MGKPSQSGSVTQTTTNPTQQAQLPFLQSGWGNAQNLYNNNPLQYYPGQTLANFNPFISSGYNDIGNLVPTVNQIIRDPANATFNSETQGLSGPQSSLNWTAGTLNNMGLAGPLRLGDYQTMLDTYGGQSASNPYAGQIGAYAAPSASNPYSSLLGGLGASGSGATSEIGALQGLASGNFSGVPFAQTGLTSVINDAARPTAAINALTNEANGAFLNKNPYIDAQYDAASRPVVNAYQTATAPQTDSNFEASGRYGGGALMNARSQNEQNLGKSLGDLSANLYGQDYANERNLMTQAQGTLGNLENQRLGLQNDASQALGNLGLNEAQTRGGLLNSAGNLAQSELGLRGNLYNQAGNQYLTGLGQAGSLLNSAGNQYLSGLNQGIGAASEGGRLGLSGYGLQTNALQGAGALYNGLNNSMLSALQQEPNVLGQNFAGDNAMVGAGQGLTGLNQAQIQDAMQRFYGNQNAPYQTLQQYLNFIGQPTNGSNSIQSPLLSNPLASAFQTIGGLNSALGPNGLGLTGGSGGGGLFGSGGLLGSGAGSLFGTDGLFGASSVGPSIDALNSAGLSAAGLSEAPFAAGSSILPDFLPFLAAAA